MGKGSNAECYDEPLLYVDLNSVGSRFETYGKGITEVSKKMILKLANRLQKMAMDRNMMQHLYG